MKVPCSRERMNDCKRALHGMAPRTTKGAEGGTARREGDTEKAAGSRRSGRRLCNALGRDSRKRMDRSKSRTAVGKGIGGRAN